MDPHIHLEQPAVFGWHTWISNCLEPKKICMLVHEHSGIFSFVTWLTCQVVVVVSWHDSHLAWSTTWHVCTGSKSHMRVCVGVFLCVMTTSKNLASNNSCALAQNCHQRRAKSKSSSSEMVFFIIVTRDKIYWTKWLLKMDLTMKSSIAAWLSFFCIWIKMEIRIDDLE